MALAKADNVQLLMLKNQAASVLFYEKAMYHTGNQNAICGKEEGGVSVTFARFTKLEFSKTWQSTLLASSLLFSLWK